MNKDIRLISMELVEDEIIAYLLFERKIVSYSVNSNNETSFLAEGNTCDFVDPEHMIKTISLFSPGTLFFRPPFRIEDPSYNGLLSIC